jgi:septal ring factor EnvC (AmiA/AmiB activator)
MIRRPYGTKEAHLICTNKCGNKSNKLIAVEKAMLDGLQKYLNNIEINLDETENIKTNATEISLLEKNINDLHNELKTLETQRLKTFDLLEQGIYDIATFTERSNLLAERINAINQSIDTCIKQLQKLKESYVDIDESIKELKHILDVYPKLDKPKDKNLLLKSVLEKIVYYKEKNWKSDNFKITLYHKTLGNIEL